MNADVARTLSPFTELRINEYDIYPHLPYRKDIYLCPPETIRLVSGNVVKYYTIEPAEKVTVDTNALAEHLVTLGKEESRRYHSHYIARPEDVIDQEDGYADEDGFHPGLSSEKLVAAAEALMAENPAVTQAAPKTVITNSFADVSEDDDDYSFLNSK